MGAVFFIDWLWNNIVTAILLVLVAAILVDYLILRPIRERKAKRAVPPQRTVTRRPLP